MKRILLASLLFLAACSHAPEKTQTVETTQPTIVLVHGSHSDGESWNLVKEKLGDKYPVLTPTLPGRKDSENPTLQDQAQSVCDQIPARSVLVGHSMGGAVINQMVGQCPEKIMRLIYVTAVVPLSGEKPVQGLSAADQKEYMKAVKFEKRATPRSAKTYFQVMDATLDKKNLPTSRLYSESLAPTENPLKFDEAIFFKIPKFYIMATQDKVISLATQRKFIARTDMAQTGEINAGHLPQFSKPAEVAQAILQSFQ